MMIQTIKTPEAGTIKVIRVWPDGSYGVHTLPFEAEGDEVAVQIDDLLPFPDDFTPDLDVGEALPSVQFGAWSLVEGR